MPEHLETTADALALLAQLRAPLRLVRHEALVAETAAALINGKAALGVAVAAQVVRLGLATLGQNHETAGHHLLERHELNL